ncbi:TetR/AcrR family transcriptional regulator [[Mycobacterium] vasticus]|uniref:TetR/AcrR family transcriptional regulator n=1 Tax=[Mycobacterium] vasticus TaxID=2875777 RepID=A0ABU5Z3J4_9MYCO|nr:TetR/AcrR family transcriptional regulator [Mycolicibacter sp. MYC017]MEB3071430.1 TetR/AcrR family transcriptional regulator [Mycolicibacter sp. MYC017]
MDAAAPRVWRGQTHDGRSQVRRTQLLRAGFELLGTEGTPGVTMRAVCRLAGLSPRYFYESFSHTDELTLEVYDRCNAELVAAIADAADTTSPIAAAIDAAAGYFEADPRRLRILLREPQSSDLLAGRRADVLPELLTELAGSAGVTDPPISSTVRAMHASALSGALTALVLDWADGRLDVSRTDLVKFATGLVLAGLGEDASTGRARSRRRSPTPSPHT